MKDKFTFYYTKGMVIAIIVSTYLGCAILIAIAALLSCFFEPTFLGLIVSIVSFSIVIVTFVISYITYQYHGGYIALGTSHFFIKTTPKGKKTKILWTDLSNVTIDQSRILHLTLKDGTSYQLKHLINVDELIACIQIHMM